MENNNLLWGEAGVGGKNEALWNSWKGGIHGTALPLLPFHFLISATKLLL